MKKYWWLLFLLTPFWSVAQVNVKWQKWPAVLQLYPRDDNNKAEVPIAGRLQSTAYSQASLLVYQNGNPWKYQRTTFTKEDKQSHFQFNPVIEAGLHHYKFVVYAIAGQDSVLVDSRENIVCGDVILFNGQSNLTGYFPKDYFYRNDYLRTFGNSSSTTIDTAWHISNVLEGQVGLIATELQRLILENHKMPTCLINGSLGGSSIKAHIYRNPYNPADTNSPYGRLLNWVQKAGVGQRVKAFVWRQGENEAGGGYAGGYEQDVKVLFENWQKDYPNVEKYYVVQNNLLPDPNAGAGQLRDFQRRTPQIFPKTEAIATVGLPDYDGIHYGQQGQLQFAHELYRLIARDVYKSTDVNGISSPSIRKAYYKTAKKDEVVLEFDPGMRMAWQQDTVVNGQLLDMRDYIYFDYASNQQERIIASGSAVENRIVLKLTKPIQATAVTYLPHFSTAPFGGPFLKNQRGMRSFTFHNFTIDTNPPEIPEPENRYDGQLDSVSCSIIRGWALNRTDPNAPLTVELLANDAILATVKAADFRQDLISGAHGFLYMLPDSIKNGNPQVISARVANTDYFLPGSPKTLTCANPNPLISGESGLETLKVSMYPNPSQGHLTIKLFIPGRQVATLRITDLSGRLIWQKSIIGAGKQHEELVDIPEAVVSALVVSVEVGAQLATRKVILSR